MVNWVQMARVTYSETRGLAKREFIEVQRAIGSSHLRIILRHILPHLMLSIIVFGTLGISMTVLLEATLSYLGVGVQPPTPSWGDTIFENRTDFANAPWRVFVPGVAIMLLALSFNLLLYVFAVQLGWFPIGGHGTFAHLVLPATTIGLLGTGWYSRMISSSMVDVLAQDCVRTARAKGLGKLRIVLRHVVPNAVLLIIAMIGIDIGLFMSGIVVVEGVFGWPGIGQLAWQAIQRVDIPIIMGVTLVSACVIVMGNLLADLIAPPVNPRIKLKD